MRTRLDIQASLVAAVPALARFATHLAGRQNAQDLVQDTLTKAWAARERFRPGSNLDAWLFTILRNTFLSRRRRLAREVEDVDGCFSQNLSDAPSQHHHLDAKRCLRAIEDLPDAYRQAIESVGLSGLSYAEAAHLAGCSIGTLKSRVARARALLRIALVIDEPAPLAEIKPVSRRARFGGSPVPAAGGDSAACPAWPMAETGERAMPDTSCCAQVGLAFDKCGFG